MILKLRSIVLLLALCVLLFFWELGDIPFYNRGEPREGLVVSEMYTTGNWILPMVNGDYIPFKPPLFHWVGVLTAVVLGNVNEFTVRFPSALFATLGVLLTYLAGARLWGERSGLISAMVLATSPEWWQTATIAQVDMTLSFFMVAALLHFLFLYLERKDDIKNSMGLSLFLALAMLAKGPVGALLPMLAIGVFLWLQRDLAFLKRLHPFASATVFLLAAGSWYALAGWQGGKAFFIRQIMEESLQTAVGAYGHFQPLYYFIPVFLINFIPWSFFLPSLALLLYKERHRLAEERLLYPLIWFVIVLLFFSLARGKRGIYILSLYPAAALLLGAWWQKLEKGEGSFPRLTRMIGYFIAGSSLSVFGVFLTLLWGEDVLNGLGILHLVGNLPKLPAIFHSLISSSPLLWACFALSGMAAVLLIWALSRKSWNYVFVSLMVIAVSATLVTKRIYYPFLASERTLKPFLERVKQEIDPRAPLFFYRSFDLGTIFYAHRHIASFQKDRGQSEEPFFLLMWEEEWKRLGGSKGLEMLDISEGTGAVGKHHMVLVRVTESGPLSESSLSQSPDDASEEPL